MRATHAPILSVLLAGRAWVAATQTIQETSCGCTAEPLQGFVRRSGSTLVDESGRSVRFASINVPNLHRIELSTELAGRSGVQTFNVGNDQSVRMPSESEVRDALCSVRQMGARVTRVYVLSHGDGDAYHVGTGGLLNEAWFQVLDMVLSIANELGVRLVIPFVNTFWYQAWGSSAFYSQWTGGGRLEESAFFSSAEQRTAFKAMITSVVSRNSTVTGKRYADEEAILAWELGNELHDVSYGAIPVTGVTPPPPIEWTRDIAQHVKALDRNHLVMDGGQFSAEALDVTELDIVGSTYYGKAASTVLADVETLEVWNWMNREELRKAFVVKEFGFVDQTDQIPLQNMAWVQEVLEVLRSHENVAGAMYWSLRFHADEGGFFHHQEQGGNIQALHWPGFTTGAPNYEIEIFELLQQYSFSLEANSSNITWTQGTRTPCAPKLGAPSSASTCLSFVGTPGAAQYELWASPAGQEQWRVVREGVPDNLQPQEALATFDPASVATVLAGVAGVQEFNFCLRACSSRGGLRGNVSEPGSVSCLSSDGACAWLVPSSCSSCSSVVTLTVDLTSAPTCNLTGYFTDFDSLWNTYYYSLFDYGSASTGMIIAVVAVSVLAVLLLCVAWCYGAESKAQQPGEALASLRAGTGRAHVLDLLRLLAAAHLALYAAVEHNWLGEVPEVMACLASWGPAQFSFLFIYAGFVSAVRYSHKAMQLDVWPQVWRSLSRFYPTFLAFAFVTLCHGAFYWGKQVTGRFIFMFPLASHAWRSDLQFGNDMAELSWVVGPLVLFSAFVLPLGARLETFSHTALLSTVAASWAVTLWQMGHFLDVRIFVLDEAITWFVLRAYTPSFVGGAALGVLFGQHYGEDGHGCAQVWSQTSTCAKRVLLAVERLGVTSAAVILLPLFLCVQREVLGEFLATWAVHGALLPLQCAALWAAAAHTDVLARPPPIRSLPSFGGLWYYLLVAAPVANILAAPITNGQDFFWTRLAAFAGALLVCAAVGEFAIRRPVASLDMPSPEDLGLSHVRAVKLTKWELTFMYYLALAAILFTFAFYALEEETLWLNVATLPDGAASTSFNITSLLLYVPAMALVMGLGGQVLYPPMLEPDAIPLKLQLQQQRLDGLAPFKIAFRIVTRGNSPTLVHESVRHAVGILEASLPRERWILEVVTDNALDLAKLGLPVVELLVPNDYKPPGGCLFKARALNYAISASSAGEHDWVVHLDEETFFDGDTVAHVMEHCAKQNALVQSGKQPLGHIGQGVILYNVNSQVNLLCCLADTVRVADDFGKFAIQYKMTQQPLIGMHGSFVVCANAVEMKVGFDHGLPGSITEDAFFAMKCAAEGVHVMWCGGHMYEQSPFGVRDFAKQRCRWFAGLWLCVRSPKLPLLHRCVLGSHVVSWAFCPMLNLLAWTNWLINMARPGPMRVSLALLYAIPLFGYLLGFFWSFSPSRLRHGVAEYLMLLALQILGVPIYALMEAFGVAKALYERPFKKFELVQKEKKPAAAAPAADAAPPAADVGQVVVDMEAAAVTLEVTSTASDRPLVANRVPIEAADSGEAVEVSTAELLPPVVKPTAPRLLGSASESSLSLGAREESLSPKAKRQGLVLESVSPSGRREGLLPCLPGTPMPMDRSEHWKTVLAGTPCAVRMPCDGPLEASHLETLPFPEAAGRELLAAQAFCGEGAEAQDVAMAAFGLLVSQLSGEDLFVMGVSCSGVAGSGTGLPVRVELDHEISLAGLAATLGAQRAQTEALAACGHVDLCEIFSAGGEEWQERRTRRGGPWQLAVHRGAAAERESVPHGADLLLHVVAGSGSARLSWVFESALYSRTTLCHWADALRSVLRALTAHPAEPLREVSLVANKAAEATVLGFSGREEHFVDEPMHRQFLACANANAEAVAVFEGDQSWTFSQLAGHARHIAACISEVVGPSTIEQWLVGLLLERSVDVVAIIYGVLMAGGGYLPMEPDFPAARIEEILLDAGPACPLVLVGDRSLAQKLPWGFTGRVACASWAGLTSPDGGHLPLTVPHSLEVYGAREISTGLAYCIYTSGSTGKPKGVLVGHRELAMRTSWLQTTFKLGSQDCVPFKTPYIFAVSEWELFWPLVSGARVAVASQSTVRSLDAFSTMLTSAHCTHMCLVPSHLAALLRCWEATGGSPSCLKSIITCGELLTFGTMQACKRVLPSVTLTNLYGPTEGSMTWRTCSGLEGPTEEALIGKPIANTAVLLLDRWGKLVPVGVPGDIHFGLCLAQGYLNRPELTRERFVPNPVQQLPGVRSAPTLYRTGDMAMWLSNGELRFLGREDRQVKVRGYRIELGAVEAALRAATRTAAAVAAVALPDGPGRPGGELVGFVEAAEDEMDGLRGRLLELLPAYMVPSRLLCRAAFPQLPSGKPDLKALFREATGASETVQGGQETVVQGQVTAAVELDSLGMARRLGQVGGSAVVEARISDNLRALLMYGVLFDHWAGCTDVGRCQAVVEGMIWRQSEAMQPSLQWVETLLRGLGNYKDMSGFMMISAYNDSAYADAAYFSKTDLIIFITYLQFMWVMDPIIWGICRAGSFDGCTADVNYFAGVHRWYLLAVLLNKLALVCFRLTRLPPLAQCALVTVAAFVMPSEVFCLTDTKCAEVNDSAFWVDNFRKLDPVWTFFFRGASADIYDMYTSVIMRYYVIFAVQYFWTFHYGRRVVACFWRHCGSRLGMLQIVAPVALLAAELANTSILGPVIYNYMQEDVTGTFEPQLVPLLLMVIGLTAEVALLALAMSRMQRRLKLLGSTTLGCYMVHMYLTYPVILLRPYFDSLGDFGIAGFVVQVLLILVLPLFVQLTIGAAFHKLLLLEYKLFFAAIAKLRCGTKRFATLRR